MEEKRCAAIILAGGSGKRMGQDVPKQLMEIAGHPVLYYSIRVFEESCVSDIVIVSEESLKDRIRELVEKYAFAKVRCIVPGGSERYESVHEGLKAVDVLGGCDIVLIHDSARPCVTAELIKRNIECAGETGACITAVRAKDTVKIADEQGIIVSTPPRDRLWIAQTPQTFDFELIKNAYEQVIVSGRTDITDDAMILEAAGGRPCRIVEGDYNNIKLTTKEDIEIIENILRKAEPEHE